MTLDAAENDDEVLSFFLGTDPATYNRIEALNTHQGEMIKDNSDRTPGSGLGRLRATLD